jgi:hypothetical protein
MHKSGCRGGERRRSTETGSTSVSQDEYTRTCWSCQDAKQVLDDVYALYLTDRWLPVSIVTTIVDLHMPAYSLWPPQSTAILRIPTTTTSPSKGTNLLSSTGVAWRGRMIMEFVVYRGCINKLLGRRGVSKVQILEHMFRSLMKTAASMYEFIRT